MYLTDYLKRHAQNQKAKTAIEYRGGKLSWGELYDKVSALSGFFADQLGDSEQQVVALLMTNSIDFVVVYLAVLDAGHIVMPVDPAYKKLEIDAMIDGLNPAMIVLELRYSEQIDRRRVPSFMADELLGKRFEPGQNLRLPPAEQIASLTFTSGTSGHPKVVPNTHANHVWNIETCSKLWQWTAKDSLLITLPLSHWYGLVMGLSGALYHGNTLYLREQSFVAREVLEDLASGRVSLFTHAPIAYSKMLEEPGDYDLSKVRLMISGSAPFPPQLWHDFKNRFGIEVIETYGSSETGRIAGNDLGEKVLGSPGRILPGVDAKISREGEVLVKSGGLFPGYWHNQAATREATAAGGFWRTGDLGEIKNDYIFLKGRVQERIRKFGYTVSPRDVEWALLENPKIKEAFVMGEQSPGSPNDKIYYFIAGDINEKEVLDYCKINLPFSWRPDAVRLLAALPRTRNGKPHVKKLQEMAA